MSLCFEEACNFRWLSDTRELSAGTVRVSKPLCSMTALSEARSSIYSVSSGLHLA